MLLPATGYCSYGEYERVPDHADTSKDLHSSTLSDSELALLRLWGCYACIAAAYFASRGWCALVDLPADCQNPWNAVEIVTDLVALFLSGFVLILWTGAHQTTLTRWHGVCAVLMLVVSPLYSLISEGASWGSFDNAANGVHAGALATIVESVGGLLLVAALAWHIWLAWVQHAAAGAAIYLLNRLLVAGLLLGATFLTGVLSGGTFHLHHYWVFWILALFSHTEHPLGLAFLAVCAGIFVQG